MSRRDAWQLWLHHHGTHIAYRLVAAAARAAGDPTDVITRLEWEAARHAQLAERQRKRVKPPPAEAA